MRHNPPRSLELLDCSEPGDCVHRMGQALFGCFVLSLGLIPTAVHSERLSLMVVSGVISLVPLFILYQPAHVSTLCDDLLGKKHSV